MRNQLGLALALSISLAPAADAGLYGQRIVAPVGFAKSMPLLKPAVADLATYLSSMTDKPFEVETAPTPSAISLLLASDPETPRDARQRLEGKGDDAFLLRADKAKLSITANDAHGLANGVYFYLEALGVRWLLPGEHWTEIPHRSDVSLTMDRLVAPAFRARGFAGTGGYYAWKWGRSYAGSTIFEAQSNDWKRRLRYGGDAYLGKSVGEGFIADKSITPILAAHPDYLAIIDGRTTPLHIEGRNGEPQLNITGKLNAGNPDAVALFCDWTVHRLREARRTRGHDRQDVVSVEPSDGYGYGNDLANLPGDGSGSDQSFFIANRCAQRVRAEFPGASVILLAYAGHAQPPSFALEPNVVVQVTPYAFQSTAPDQFIAAWKKKAAALAIYDYWSIPDWTHDEPTFDYLDLAKKLRYWKASNIDGIQAESTYSAGAMGLSHYLAAHLMWDLGANETALADDWFEKAFGAAEAPMRRMLERWARSFQLSSAELYFSYRDLDEAARLARGSPKISARLDDYIRYVHFLQLRMEAEQAPDAATKTANVLKLVEYLLDINSSNMVGTTRQVDLYGRTFPDIYREFPVLRTDDASTAWSRIRPLSHDEVRKLLADGLRAYPSPPFEVQPYSPELALVTPDARKHRTTGDVTWLRMPTVGDMDLHLRVPADLPTLSLHVSRHVDNQITVHRADGETVATAHIEMASAETTNAMARVDFHLSPGSYTLHFHPAGGRATGYFSFEVPYNVPMAMQDFLSPKSTPSPRLYFFVPPNLKTMAMYFPRGDYNGAFRLRIRDPDGQPAAIAYLDDRHTLTVHVPQGQDGKIWSIENSVSPNEPLKMLNVPQAFSLSPNHLMTSVDALPRTASRR